MKARLVILSFLLLSLFTSQAHRLNEYLQATTITLTKDHVLLKVRMTAGSDVAAGIISGIDRNKDGIFSAEEQSAYAQSVLRELSVGVDDHQALPRLLSWSFPTPSAMKEGLGEIQLAFQADVPNHNLAHRLVLRHSQSQAATVYLVNCLQPEDPTIHVNGQSRNIDQSVYSLDFSTTDTALSLATTSPGGTGQTGVLKTFFFHGVKHILTGFDHLLFLCALVLGAAGLWDLVKIVTAFTIAHSLTLALAAFGLAHLPAWIVEPFIAASIVFVAVQNIYRPQDAGSRKRLFIAFFFGLFHGLGFAGGLLELMHSMPASTLVYGLLGFSIGVEAGNQLVLLPLYGIVRGLRLISYRKFENKKASMSIQAASALVAVAGLYYLVIAIWQYR